MLRNLEFIRIILIIDIGEEIFNDKYNIKFENIVIDYFIKKKDDMIFYNFDKTIQDREFERTESLNSPPTVLLAALNKLITDHERKGSHIAESVRLMMTKNPRLRGKYQHPGAEHDKLYESSYTHRGGDDRCEIGCDSTSPPLLRQPRQELDPNEPVVHYGLIASALFPRRWANGSISGISFHKWRFCLVQGLCTKYRRNFEIWSPIIWRYY